ncbi:hypothetical protein FAM09_26470 [Niastella caeni]|uniref:Esterase family protein n=1 Tax=Niastella caeni TaxID=2569763 RepID=A0A4S8HEZ7_9BACT|nr:alpha/beta hydrolase-fold protein [Niastella caeni]THU32991.1 hypothetical protein FAM09_26470 [Niastella caeni]
MYIRIIKTILLVLLFGVSKLKAQNGTHIKDLTFKSKILNEDIKYDIYLPPQYDTTKKYPCIYYLHCFGADNHLSSHFTREVDSLIKLKQFPEVIIVSPFAKNSWYLDDYSGKYKYSSMFINEYLPFIKKQYSIFTEPSKTVITGFSMGGFGALRFTMLYPEYFGICVSFMAGMSTKEQICQDSDADYAFFHQKIYGDNLKTTERANKYFVDNNPLYIAEIVNTEILRKSKWYIQSCDDDYHSLGNVELHAVFHKKGVKHEFRVNDGSHDGNCVNRSMQDALRFIKSSIADR